MTYTSSPCNLRVCSGLSAMCNPLRQRWIEHLRQAQKAAQLRVPAKAGLTPAYNVRMVPVWRTAPVPAQSYST